MNETKFADSSEEESLGRFAQYIDYPKEMPFHDLRFECGDPGITAEFRATFPESVLTPSQRLTGLTKHQNDGITRLLTPGAGRIALTPGNSNHKPCATLKYKKCTLKKRT